MARRPARSPAQPQPILPTMLPKTRQGQSNERILLLAMRIGVLALLVYWSFVLLQPFIPILAWSTVMSVALYPAYDRLASSLGRQRTLAAVILTFVALAIVIGPAAWLGAGLIDSVRELSRGLDAGQIALPSPPAGIKQWPVIGQQLYDLWSSASLNLEVAIKQLSPYLKPLAGYAVAFAGGAGVGMLKFLLSIVLSGFLFLSGPRMVEAIRDLLSQLVPERSEFFLSLATETIRSVSKGIIGIALLQALLAGIALKLAGVPHASVLAFAVLMFCVLQIGSAIVLFPVMIWIWSSKDVTVAVVMTIVLGLIGIADNILKPMVIGPGLRTPMLVIFLGVMGGTLAHGIVGLFIGPIVLAVAWDLLVAWVHETKADVPLHQVETPERSRAAPNLDRTRLT